MHIRCDNDIRPPLLQPLPGAGQHLIQRLPVSRAMIDQAEHRRRVAEINVLRH